MVVAFPFAAALKGVGPRPDGGNRSVPDVVNWMRAVSQQSLDSLTFPVHYGILSESGLLYVPPGWITFEAAIGNILSGLHFSLLPNTWPNSENYKAVEEALKASTTDSSKVAIYSAFAGAFTAQPPQLPPAAAPPAIACNTGVSTSRN